MFVFLTAAFKYYILSCIVITSLVYQVVQRDEEEAKDWQMNGANNTLTFAFAMLFFGSLVDNLRGYQKQIIIILEVSFGIINLVQAAVEYHFFIEDDAEKLEHHK